MFFPPNKQSGAIWAHHSDQKVLNFLMSKQENIRANYTRQKVVRSFDQILNFQTQYCNMKQNHNNILNHTILLGVSHIYRSTELSLHVMRLLTRLRTCPQQEAFRIPIGQRPRQLWKLNKATRCRNHRMSTNLCRFWFLVHHIISDHGHMKLLVIIIANLEECSHIRRTGLLVVLFKGKKTDLGTS